MTWMMQARAAGVSCALWCAAGTGCFDAAVYADEPAENSDRAGAAAPQDAKPAPESDQDNATTAGTEAVRTNESATLPATPPAKGEEIYARLMKSTAWIVAQRPGADRYDWGTAWVIDRNRRLVVTNQHVVYDEDAHEHFDDEHFRVFFPEYMGDDLLTDRNDRLQNGKFVTAELIEMDSPRDLAVLRVAELPEGIESISLAAASPKPGQTLHSLGNPGSSEALWVYTVGTVRQVYQASERFPDTVYQYRRVETQSPTNEGDSGGPAVNDRGELIAVNHGYRIESRLMTRFIDVSEVKAMMQTVDRMLVASSAEELVERGEHYYNGKRYDRAIEDFTAANQLDPLLAKALGKRGWAWHAKGDEVTAKADFDEAIKLDPREADFHHGRAKVYIATDDYDAAITDCIEAIRLAPQNAAHYNLRGDAYFYQEKYEPAIADYTEAISHDEQVGEYFNNRGASLSRLGKNREALADYTHAIQLNPNEPQYLFNRASSYHKLQEPLPAIADLMQLEQQFPDFAAAQRSHYDRRYLRAVNATQERLQLWVKYHTYTTDGEWKWFPAEPGEGNWAVFWLDPGESTYLTHDEFKINADRVRIWAGNARSTKDWNKSTRMWTEYEEQDLLLLPAEGEDGYFMLTYELKLE